MLRSPVNANLERPLSLAVPAAKGRECAFVVLDKLPLEWPRIGHSRGLTCLIEKVRDRQFIDLEDRSSPDNQQI